MMSHTLLVACLLGLAVLAQGSGPKICPSGCALMEEGKREGSNKVLRCKSCSTGYYTPKVGACCIECKNGIITTNATAATCNLCPKDSDPKKSSTGAPTCMCKSGTQANGTAPITGVSGCTKCPAGTFNPNRTQALDACQPCPAGLVSGPGAERCTACPANTTANAAQTGCDCASNFFAVPRTTNRTRLPRKIVSRSSGSDDIKPPVCSQCADPTANLAPNLWPACCAAGSSWNGTACVCPNGGTWDGVTCTCPTGAAWNITTTTCDCADGATFADQACSCADGAQYDNNLCKCDGATWDSSSKTCVCDLGTWNGTACAE